MKRYHASGGLKVGSRATIYFVQVGAYVKIGISRNPAKRLRNLRYTPCSPPDDIDLSQPFVLLHTIPDSTLRDEFAMHCHFEEWWIGGEWFRFDADFERGLADIAANGIDRSAA
jgi:hypothetical protein